MYGGAARQQRPVKRRTLAVMVTAGVLAVLVVALVLVLTVFKPGSGTPKYGLIPTGSSAQQNGEQVAAAFLTAWETGDLTKAANYTDKPSAAAAALAAYPKYLNLKSFAATPGAVTDAAGSTTAQPRESVTFAVSASVAAGSGKAAVRGKWAYHSKLVAYQQANSSVWFVAWQPDVVAPNLTAATHLAAVTVPPTVSMVTDASGANLTRYGDAGLSTIAGPAQGVGADQRRGQARPERADRDQVGPAGAEQPGDRSSRQATTRRSPPRSTRRRRPPRAARSACTTRAR